MEMGGNGFDKQAQEIDISTNHGYFMFRYSPSLLTCTVIMALVSLNQKA